MTPPNGKAESASRLWLMQTSLPQKSGMAPELALDSPQLSMCEEALQKSMLY